MGLGIGDKDKTHPDVHVAKNRVIPPAPIKGFEKPNLDGSRVCSPQSSGMSAAQGGMGLAEVPVTQLRAGLWSQLHFLFIVKLTAQYKPVQYRILQ